MARGELEHDVRGGGIALPLHLLHRHKLALGVLGTTHLVETHRPGIVETFVGDVAIMYGERSVVHPSVGRLLETVYHGSHTRGEDIAFSILPAFLQIEHTIRHVHAFDRGTSADTLLDTVGRTNDFRLVVELDGFRTLGERHAETHFAVRVLGAVHRLYQFAEEKASGGKHLDIHHAKHLARLEVGIELGTVTMAFALLTVDRSVGLDYAHRFCKHIGGCPRASTEVPVGFGLVGAALRCHFVKGLHLAAHQVAFLDFTDIPGIEITEGEQLVALYGISL